jgi:hypothetical protein
MQGSYWAFDPGPRIGVAVYDPGAQRTRGFADYFRFFSIDVEDHPYPYGYIHDWLSSHLIKDDILIIEKFEFRKDDQTRDKIDYSPGPYSGCIATYSEVTNEFPPVWQSPSLATGGFWGSKNGGNDKIKKLGLWRPGRDERHKMDALRHLLYYLTFGPKGDQFEILHRLK